MKILAANYAGSDGAKNVTELIPSVVVCGKIRDSESFSRDLDVYENWLRNNEISRLVFSGWVEDAHNPLIFRLVELGARIVLSEPPILKGHGHFYHQMKSLYYGLLECEDDELVLRSRTDKVWLNFNPLEVAQRWREAPPPQDPSPYVRRVFTLAALVGQPFFFNDMMLFGRCDDLLKMVAFDLWPELDHALLNPEQQFHYQPYRRAGLFPATQAFLGVNPGILTNDEETSRRVGHFLMAQPIYLRALAEGLTAFERHYRMGFNESPSFSPPDTPTLDDLYDLAMDTPGPQKLVFCSNSKALVTQNGAAVSWMLDQPISRDDPRTLRQIADQQTPSRRVLQNEALQLAESFQRSFPNHPHGPAVSLNRDGIHLVAARPPVVWIG